MDSFEELSMLQLKTGGFSFENCARNATLEKMGIHGPKERKTGTTIVAAVFKDGVVIGADSRATSGELIADKDCMKLHKLSESIYAAGAGTAADLDQVCKLLKSNLKLLELNSDRKPRVIAAIHMARQHLFRYQGYVGAYLLIAGVDFYGPHLASVHAAGSSLTEPFMADGSGSLAAKGVLESEFKVDMTEEEGVNLVKKALMAGMHGDLSSGNSLRWTVIRKDGASPIEKMVPDFCQAPAKDMKYESKTTPVLKAKRISFDVVEKMEVS